MSSKVRLSAEQKQAFLEVAKAILKYSLLGLAVGIVLTSPYGLSRLIPELIKLRKKFGDQVVDKSIDKIFKDRFVCLVQKDGKTQLRITQKGKAKIVDFDIDTLKIKKQKWDGVWRIVIFDIPEKLRFARNILRSKLVELGFVKLQKSVWISPYECQSEISFICSVFEVEKFVNYGELSKIDCEEYLESKFNL